MSSFELKCEKCTKCREYDCADLDWERVESSDRGMGDEIHHQAEFECSCECGQRISVEFNCWEYPAGTINDSDVDVSGAELISDNCTPSICRVTDEEDE